MKWKKTVLILKSSTLFKKAQLKPLTIPEVFDDSPVFIILLPRAYNKQN